MNKKVILPDGGNHKPGHDQFSFLIKGRTWLVSGFFIKCRQPVRMVAALGSHTEDESLLIVADPFIVLPTQRYYDFKLPLFVDGKQWFAVAFDCTHEKINGFSEKSAIDWLKLEITPVKESS